MEMATARQAMRGRVSGEGEERGILVVVGNAVNGTRHAIRLASNDLAVDELRETLAACSDIPSADQILLGGPPFARLDPRRALGHYGIPAEDKRVFLYDRRMLAQDNPVPPHVALQPVEVEVPSEPVTYSEGSRMLSESSSPLLRALADYESHFHVQVTQCEALERGSAANVAACERCAAELEVQAEAIGAAVSNLELFRSAITKHFEPFWNEHEQVAARHERLMGNFETALSALRDVTLHPALATDEHKTLYDCVPVDREREWAQQCEQSHAVMRTQVTRLKQVHDEICSDVAALERSQDGTSVEYAGVIAELQRMRQHLASQSAIRSKLTANLEVVTKKIAETSADMQPSGMMFASTNALEVCRGIDELFREQHDLLPTVEKYAEEIKSSMGMMSSVKVSFFGLVHSNLRRISVIQSKIRDFENSLAMLKEAMTAQIKHFNVLEHVEKLPESYNACLQEITRRIQYGRQFADRIKSMAEELAQLRDEEVHQREMFLRTYGQHLPRDFIPGLAEKPSHCEFRMRPFDQNLPQIKLDAAQQPSPSSGTTVLTSDPATFDQQNQDSSSSNLPEDATAVHDANVIALQQRCEELEAKVAELSDELQSKRDSCFYSVNSGSLARSDASRHSARDDGSAEEFPIILGLADATVGSPALVGTPLHHNVEPVAQGITASQALEKDAIIARLERENQQHLMNATELEREMAECTRREQRMQERQSRLEESIQLLQRQVDVRGLALMKVFTLLGLSYSRDGASHDQDEIDATQMELVEGRLRELLASADSEKLLHQELTRRQDELTELRSQQQFGSFEDELRISFCQFRVNDIALFIPTASVLNSEGQFVYAAFHYRCPNRFLSEESIASFTMEEHKRPDYVIGRIVLIDEHIATESNNPFHLPLGTMFFVLTVTSLQDRGIAL